ncbi:MAG: sugar phosphate isomerase/epimerase [bacterium]
MNSSTLRTLTGTLGTLVVLAACSSGTTSSDVMSSAPAPAGSRQITYRGDFHAPMGVQLWSFRDTAKTDPSGMMLMARRMGITHVETAGLYGMPVEQFADALRSAGLRATSMHVGYDELTKTPAIVIANARALGAKYVGLAWYPHTGAFTEADARKAIADFNQIGRTMKDAGLTFFYHNHGYEPAPYGNGTLLDLIIRETDPALVSFEMDVLWTFYPGVDPAALIRKYPGRFKLMHIKDMKPGVARGSLSGGLPAEQQSVVGEGQVNWSDVLSAAQKGGVELYFLEDETPDPIPNVPKSITFLERLKY